MRLAALLAALALAAPLPVAVACVPRRAPRPAAHAAAAGTERARWLMGTLCTAVAATPDTARAAAAIAAAFDEIARLERVMSSWRGDSELARLNSRAAAPPFACSTDLFAVLDSAAALAAATGGAFDPTVEPLARAWDLRGEGRVPGPAERDSAAALVGWRMLVLDRGGRTAAFARPGMGVDLGGIGKGYALDRAADTLRARGVTRALVNFGGEVLALAGDGAPWRVTVAHPADRLRPVVGLGVSNAAVSTSAQAERGFTRDGVRHGHVLDPRTGAPATAVGSATVVAPSGTRADALSTALLVLGREAAADFARAHPECGVLWLEPQGDGVRAWAWNLAGLSPEAGARVEWMDRP